VPVGELVASRGDRRWWRHASTACAHPTGPGVLAHRRDQRRVGDATLIATSAVGSPARSRTAHCRRAGIERAAAALHRGVARGRRLRDLRRAPLDVAVQSGYDTGCAG